MEKKEPWKELWTSFAFMTALLVLAGTMTLQSHDTASAGQVTYSNEDLEQAFHQRDQAIEIMVAEISSLRERVSTLEGKKNEESVK